MIATYLMYIASCFYVDVESMSLLGGVGILLPIRLLLYSVVLRMPCNKNMGSITSMAMASTIVHRSSLSFPGGLWSRGCPEGSPTSFSLSFSRNYLRLMG